MSPERATERRTSENFEKGPGSDQEAKPRSLSSSLSNAEQRSASARGGRGKARAKAIIDNMRAVPAFRAFLRVAS